MRGLLVASAVLMFTAGGLMAGEKALKSGLQPGDSAGAFNVLDITGPKKGTKLCYR